MKIRLAAPLQGDSVIDGFGVRTVIWTQGCSHNCKGCHNPQTHDFKGGYEETVENLKEEIASLELQDGITFSGGDPMFQPKACGEIAKFAKDRGLTVWCYTGFTFEELLKLKNPDVIKFLEYIDVLIDGKFDITKRSLDVIYRGSTNQRLIDIPRSLKENKCVEVTKFSEEKSNVTKKRKVFI